MHRRLFLILLLACATAPVRADAPGGTLQLTVYNDGFASVKERRVLDVKKGENELRITGMTSQLEPDSVVLRDLKDADALRILEQNYEANPLSQQSMLRKSEGQTLNFEQVNNQTGERKLIQGKIIRAGSGGAQYDPYGGARTTEGEPIVEVDGKIGFGLPGRPLFDMLDPKGFLLPTLLWKLDAASGGSHNVEIDYLTGGLRWEASYNFVAGKGDKYDVVGWITLDNQSGKEFQNADVKLVAGEVHRVPRDRYARGDYSNRAVGYAMTASPEVTERSFDEYHLYTLPRPTTIRDRETKQVEFIRATEVPVKRFYVYDGAKTDLNIGRRTDQSYGTQSNPTVNTMLEVTNSKQNGLGMPLPKGRVKLYRSDVDGRNEFIGEDVIRHTPKDETVRLSLGNAFDLTGERRQTNYQQGRSRDSVDESFEIKVRNHKKEAVEVRVVEHLWRATEWTISAKSQDFTKLDANQIEFRVPIKPDGEAVVTYTVHYQW